MHVAVFGTLSLIVGLFFLILWIYAIIDIAKNEFRNNDKVVWLLLVILLPCIGTIMYFWLGRQKKIQPPTDEFV